VEVVEDTSRLNKRVNHLLRGGLGERAKKPLAFPI